MEALGVISKVSVPTEFVGAFVVVRKKGTDDYVLDTCKKVGITLNFAKCKFRMRSLHFLGEVISDKGIQPDPNKIKLLQEWPVPHDVTSLQSFFGMLNFLSKFISYLAIRTEAMRSLLKKGSTVNDGISARALI